MKKAYTLSEVLITIVIVGIVAVLTIPSFIARYQKHYLQISFARSVSIFQNAVKLSLNECGIDNLSNESDDFFWNNFIPQLLKNLKVLNTYTATRSTPYYLVWNYSKTRGGVTCFTTDKPDTTISFYRLVDGQLFCFRSLGGWRGATYTVTVDTNGNNKGPNRYGYDVFEFNITDTLRGYNQHNENFYCTINSDHMSNGRFCAFYALKDINPDDNTKKYWDSLKY